MLATLAGCRQDEVIPLPNRVLDRPLDLVLGCFRTVAGDVEALPMSFCDSELPITCGAQTATGEGAPQVLGFIANSERSEVALARRCDTSGGIVDLDPEAPGYNLLPVGRLPSRMAATELACQVYTVNAGSCDVSVVDARRLAAYALEGATIDRPSSALVSTLVPTATGGRPLASRASEIVALPARLSTAPTRPEFTPGSAGGTCSAENTGSVVLSFPGCQLVAEVDVASQRVLQSRRFVARPEGGFVLEDAGTDPVCPVDCPAQVAGRGDEDVPLEVGGFRPTALALVEADASEVPFVDYDALFVGGLGGAEIFEIPIDATGRWAPPEGTSVLPLEAPQGVAAIRPTPTVEMGAELAPHQFLYVVAGDGSTRVVDRSPEPDALGVECDTQVDPSVDASRQACAPILATGEPNAHMRRPGALGPGLRAPGGAAITDWTFFSYPGSGEVNAAAPNTGGGPFDSADPQVVGIGVTSLGQVIYAVLDQYQEAPTHNALVDPTGVMNLAVPPHSLWPEVDPTIVDVERSALPRLRDNEPVRTQPAGEFSLQALAPTLRRIDAAYSGLGGSSQAQQAAAASLGNPRNVDGLGGASESLYENTVAKVVARDYQTWVGDDWALAWEGDIPGTRSATGRLQCASPVTTSPDDPSGASWEGGLCHPGSNDPEDPLAGPMLVDQGAAFCDRGVLPGDKVVLLGCRDDAECGIGQRCLREPRAPSSATGICISESAFDQDFERLRVLCAPFINDPCGQTRREYLVTRAFQDQLYLQALDVRSSSVLRQVGEPPVLEEVEGAYSCLPQPSAPLASCYSDDDCSGEAYCAPDGVCRACTGGEPGCLACVTDGDCATDFGPSARCLEGSCARPCSPGEPECTRAPLPGPLCFPELVDYVVRAHDSFIVQRGGAGFYVDRVTTRGALAAQRGEAVDPATKDECVEDPSVSPLLTSRIRLGADAYATFDDPENPYRIDPCSDPDAVALDDPNPCRLLVPRDHADPLPPLFHTFSYFPANEEPRSVPAIRFSNPSLTFTLDLVSLLDLARPPAAFPRQRWPGFAAEFRRSRIPENYRESFTTLDGYDGIALSVTIGDAPLVYPIRIIPGAERYSAYIVDAGGRGGTSGVRGQIARIEVDGYVEGTIDDQFFRVR